MEEEIKVKPKKSMKKVIIFGILIVIFCSAAIILISTHEELITHSIIEYGQEQEFQKALKEDNKSYHVILYRIKYSNELKELKSRADVKDPHHLLKDIKVGNYYVVDLRGVYYFELGDYEWFESEFPDTPSGWVRSVKKNYYEVTAVDSITEMTLEELKENGEY